MSDPSFLVTNPTRTDPSLAPAGRQIYYVLFPTPNLDARRSTGARDGPRYRDEVRRDARGARLRRLRRRHRGRARDDAAGLGRRAGWSAARRSPPRTRSRQTGPFRPRNLWGENVVFAGSGTQPGVGVPMVLISGRLAAERILGPDPSYRRVPALTACALVPRASSPDRDVGGRTDAVPSDMDHAGGTHSPSFAPTGRGYPRTVASPIRPRPVDPDSGIAFTLRYAIPGLVGMAVLAVGAVGVGWIPLGEPARRHPADPHAADHQPRSVRLACVGDPRWRPVPAGLARGRRRRARRARPRHPPALGRARIWCAPLLLAPPLFSRDVYSYFVQGKLMLSGGDPYTAGVASIPGWFRDGVDPMWQFTPTPYGPLFLALSRGVAAFVGDNPYLAVVAFRVIALCGVALLAYYVPRLAFHCGIDASKALWLGVMNPLVLMHFVAGAHNDALMIGLVVAGLAIAVEGRPMVGVLVLSLAGMVKPIGLLALPFIGLVWAGTRADLRGRLIAWAKTAATFGVSYLVLAGVVGTSLGWIRALTTPGEVKTWLSPSTALGMASGNLLSWIGLGDHLDTTVGIFRIAGEIAAVVIVGYLCLKPQGRTAVRSLALAFVAVVALGPVVQPWYLLWALPLAAASGLSARELRVVVILTAAFTLYGLWETSASADNLLELSDGLAMLASAAAIGIAVTISPRERALVFGGEMAHGLMPDDQPAAARRERLVVRDPSNA